MRWDDLSSAQFRERVNDSTLAVWPIGILESHGPHLPLATDAIQAEWGAETLARAVGAVVLSPMRFGNAVATRPYPGSISLPFDTLRAFVRDTLSEVARNGVRRILVLSGHLGRDHMAAIRVAATDVAEANPDIALSVLSDWEIVYEIRDKPPADYRGVPIPPDDSHGGMLETSRVLAIAPDLVDMRRAPTHIPRVPSPEFRIMLGADRTYPQGVLGGDASKATAELGREVNRIVEARLRRIADGLLKAP
jgi:creatinine amidohydrolase